MWFGNVLTIFMIASLKFHQIKGNHYYSIKSCSDEILAPKFVLAAHTVYSRTNNAIDTIKYIPIDHIDN